MAAPSYLIKLKFGTEVDQKAFREIEDSYNKLSQKQKQIFAKNYNSSVAEMNKVFKKETNLNMRDYERAATKTEQTLTKNRVGELRKYIMKRNEQMKRLPKYAMGAMGVAGLGVANAAIGSSFSLTQYEKNSISKTMNMAAAGAGAGTMGGPWGVAIGAFIGGTAGLIISQLENSSDKIKSGANMFNTAVATYKSTLQATGVLDTDFDVSNITDEGRYMAFRSMLQSSGVQSDAMLEMLFARIARMPGFEEFGQRLMASSEDAALLALEELVKDFANKRGISIKQAVVAGQEEGGLLGLGRAGAPFVKLFSSGIQESLNEEMRSAVRVGLIKPGEDISVISKDLRKAENLRKRNEIDERWLRISQAKQLSNLDLNNDILKANIEAFERSKKPMQEMGVLLSGLNYTLQTFDKELQSVMNEITGKTGRVTTTTERFLIDNNLITQTQSSRINPATGQAYIMNPEMAITTGRNQVWGQTLTQ